MGVGPRLLEVIVREAANKPIKGTVLTLGRQTMYASPDQARQLLLKYGLTPATSEFSLDSLTKQTLSDGQTRVSDVDFFKMLGADDVKALDVSDYEGADIIHSLNDPIPDELEGICDFMVDGSTLDNIYGPSTALRNVARLLKVGGRCILDNRGNAAEPGIAYMMFSAPWFFDFFTANNFQYCQVWCLVHLPDSRSLVYMMSPEAAMREWGNGGDGSGDGYGSGSRHARMGKRPDTLAADQSLRKRPRICREGAGINLGPHAHTAIVQRRGRVADILRTGRAISGERSRTNGAWR